MIGNCYFELYQYDNAIIYFLKATKLFNNEDIKSIYGLGLSYKNINDNQKAAKFFKLGITINPDFPPMHFQLIDVYHLIDKPREAKKECDILYMLDRPLYYSSRFCNN
jgi:tetratricopeptide (TPR) repeat protein